MQISPTMLYGILDNHYWGQPNMPFQHEQVIQVLQQLGVVERVDGKCFEAEINGLSGKEEYLAIRSKGQHDSAII
jgi:hypothetical protein